MPTEQALMNLTSTPETVQWPETHYVYLERIGPFETNAPQAWQEFLKFVPAIIANNRITGRMAFYKMEGQIYRAGVSVAAKPEHLPAGVSYRKLPGGAYARLTLTGSYRHLPEASGQAWNIIHSSKLALRDDYNIENYVNDPRTTPEDQLITEIMFPIAAEPDKAAILAVIDGMAKARFEKNAWAIAASYTPDAAIFNLAPPLVHHGIDIDETQEWLDTWDGPIRIDPRDFEITVRGDLAFCHGYMRITGNKKGVEKTVSFWMRETLCLERNGNSWRVVHEHTSVPFYMDGSSRPAFDLEP